MAAPRVVRYHQPVRCHLSWARWGPASRSTTSGLMAEPMGSPRGLGTSRGLRDHHFGHCLGRVLDRSKSASARQTSRVYLSRRCRRLPLHQPIRRYYSDCAHHSCCRCPAVVARHVDVCEMSGGWRSREKPPRGRLGMRLDLVPATWARVWGGS